MNDQPMTHRVLVTAALAVASALALAGCSASPATPAASAGWGGSDDLGLAPLGIPTFGPDVAAHVVLTGGHLQTVQGTLAEASSFTITAACSGASGTTATYYLLTGATDTAPTATVASPVITETIPCDGTPHEKASTVPISGPIKVDLRELLGGQVPEFYAELVPTV